MIHRAGRLAGIKSRKRPAATLLQVDQRQATKSSFSSFYVKLSQSVHG
jgi:hypothetical protein